LKTSFENGINFFDTADVYGSGRNEGQIGLTISKIIDQRISTRHQIIIASKCGIVNKTEGSLKRCIDNSYDYVINACNQSLARLGQDVGYIDLFYLHRVNQDQLEDSMKAMTYLLKTGKIRSVGLSEASLGVIKRANNLLKAYSHGKHQIIALQVELSLISKQSLSNGTLDYCLNNDISFVAYSPLCRGLLTSEIEDRNHLAVDDFRRSLPRFQKDNISYNLNLLKSIKQVADDKSCTTAQIALAWVKSIGAIAIAGTTKENNLISNIRALEIHLTDDEVELLSSIGNANGYRYSEEAMQLYGLDDEMSEC
ncbi:MAG TPA: aldo/keto reductase, partial [Coxiellaceae bacterium]|nr:aldo/keto reductase [Coxiellaceae bacterium]